LLSFGLALREQGWRLTYLGAESLHGEMMDVAAAPRP
jgi:hypothetical protein